MWRGLTLLVKMDRGRLPPVRSKLYGDSRHRVITPAIYSSPHNNTLVLLLLLLSTSLGAVGDFLSESDKILSQSLIKQVAVLSREMGE
jgi:hypothetical protein